MKKLLLAMLAVVLCVGTTLAQRRTVTEAIYYDGDGTTTYGYILQNGERVYDGPRTIKTKREDSDRIGVYGSYYDIYTDSNLSITSNYNKGLLNGAVKVTEWERIITRAVRGYDRSEEVYNATFSGNYVNGVPNGRFLFEGKKNKDDVVTTTGYVSATYNMGVFTGAFKYIEVCDGYSVEVSGTFSKSGKMEGKWHFITGKEYDYQFRNGILVGGGPQPLNAKNAALATKYANGQITQKELKANNLMVREVAIPLWREYGVDCGVDLYGSVFSLLPFVDEKDVKERKVSLSTYLEVVEIPYFTDAGFESVWGRIQRELEDKKDAYQSIDAVLTRYKDTDLYCMEFPNWNEPPYECTISGWMIKRDEYQRQWWRYILTDDQLKRVKDLVEKHNLEVEKKQMDSYLPKIKEGYLNGARNEITIDNKQHDVVAVRMESIDRKTGNVLVEIDSREYKRYAGNNYILVTHKAEYDGTKFQNLVPIRNKYDDIADAKKAAQEEAKGVFDNISALEATGAMSGGTILWQQVSAFKKHYNNNVENVKIDHDNLNATIADLKGEIQAIKNFGELLPKYAEASKLNEQIVEQGVAKHTSTAMPKPATWNNTTKAESIDKIIEKQKQILKLWETLRPLKEKVDKTHLIFAESSDAILSDYKTSYSTVSQRVTLEERIKRYTNFIPVQEKALALWNEYKALKAKAEKAHSVLVAANDPILAKYHSEYEVAAKTKGSLESGIAAYNNFIIVQDKTIKLWEEFSALRTKATQTHNAICAANMPIMGEYTALYDTTVKGISSLENGVESYNNIIATQQSATKYIAIYKEVIATNTTLPDTIKPVKCAAKAYKTYYKGLDFTWKAEGAVERITKIWTIQQLLVKISARPTLKADNKRVKKLKLTDIDEIIKAYFNGEAVNVGEPNAEFVIKADAEVKAEKKPHN
ncbi:MAG: hypothetical protein IKL20_00430 [Alistipes sp.]|nr:hypothetical protein [Alistipes sp.]